MVIIVTKFSDIYNKAMFRFADYGFLNLGEEQRDEIMQTYLMSAIADFNNSCATGVDYNSEDKQFSDDLDEEVQEIIALGVAYYWLSSKVLNSDLLRNIMYRGDFKAYSPANLLKEMKELRDLLRKEFRGKINEYSYINGKLNTLKAGS